MRVLNFRDLKARKGIPYCRVHLRRLEATGEFPARFHLGSGRGSVVWSESEVDAYLRDRAAERPAVNGGAAE